MDSATKLATENTCTDCIWNHIVNKIIVELRRRVSFLAASEQYSRSFQTTTQFFLSMIIFKDLSDHNQVFILSACVQKICRFHKQASWSCSIFASIMTGFCAYWKIFQLNGAQKIHQNFFKPIFILFTGELKYRFFWGGTWGCFSNLHLYFSNFIMCSTWKITIFNIINI